MGPERRGRAVHGRLEVNPSGEEPTDRPRQKKLKSFEIPKASRVRGVEEGPSEQWSAGRGRCERRRFRGRRGGQPLQAVESDVFGELFPGAGASG